MISNCLFYNDTCVCLIYNYIYVCLVYNDICVCLIYNYIMSYLYVFLSENLWLGIRDIRYHTRRVLSLSGGTVTLITCMFVVDITIIMCHHDHVSSLPLCFITIMYHHHHDEYGMGFGDHFYISSIFMNPKLMLVKESN